VQSILKAIDKKQKRNMSFRHVTSVFPILILNIIHDKEKTRNRALAKASVYLFSTRRTCIAPYATTSSTADMVARPMTSDQ